MESAVALITLYRVLLQYFELMVTEVGKSTDLEFDRKHLRSNTWSASKLRRNNTWMVFCFLRKYQNANTTRAPDTPSPDAQAPECLLEFIMCARAHHTLICISAAATCIYQTTKYPNCFISKHTRFTVEGKCRVVYLDGLKITVKTVH